MDVYGNIINVIVDPELVQFVIVDTENNNSEINRIDVTKMDVVFIDKSLLGGNSFDGFYVNDDSNAEELYNFFVNNCRKAEWGHFKCIFQDNFITTSHQDDQDFAGSYLFARYLKYTPILILDHTHSHPGGTPYPSGMGEHPGDIQFAAEICSFKNFNTKFHIKVISSDKNIETIHYTPFSTVSDFNIRFKHKPLIFKNN